MNIAIILAGGKGTRVGANIPKQFIEVMGKPVLAYTLEVFENNLSIDAIEIVSHKDWLDVTEEIVKRYHMTKVKWIVEGGSTFQESVMKGLFYLENKISYDDIAVISFGVSPMTTDEIIDDSIRVCNERGNAVAAQDMVLCTCIKEDEFSSTHGIMRETIKGFSNPWSFHFGQVCGAYHTALESGIIDEIEPHTTSLYFALGRKVYFSKTTSTNIKITTKEDLDMFEGYLLLQQKRAEKRECCKTE